MKKELTEAMRLRKEMDQRGKELDAIRKRANQLMEKSPALSRDESAELDRLMKQDLPEKQRLLDEVLSKVMKSNKS